MLTRALLRTTHPRRTLLTRSIILPSRPTSRTRLLSSSSSSSKAQQDRKDSSETSKLINKTYATWTEFTEDKPSPEAPSRSLVVFAVVFSVLMVIGGVGLVLDRSGEPSTSLLEVACEYCG